LERDITDIILVTGYMKEQFYYLKGKYPVTIIENKDYLIRNNNSSIYAARKYLKNTYICSADNYFMINPFEKEVAESYYAASFASGHTDEWCIKTDDDDFITEVRIGGNRQWYLLGHVFWSEEFSSNFIQILEAIYNKNSSKNMFWEDIWLENLQQLKMKIRRYPEKQIYEFDSLDELRSFDSKYINHSGSAVMHKISDMLNCDEGKLTNIKPLKTDMEEVIGISFDYNNKRYQFIYTNDLLAPIPKG